MLPLLDLEFSKIFITAFVLGLIIAPILLIAYVMSWKRKNLIIHLFSSNMVFIVIWLSFYLLSTLAPTIALQNLFLISKYIIFLILSYSFLHSAYAYRYYRLMSFKKTIISLILPTIILLSSGFLLFHAPFQFGQILPVIATIVSLNTFLNFVTGSVFLLSNLQSLPNYQRKQRHFFTLAYTIPLVLHLLSILHIIRSNLPLEYVSLPITLVLILVAIRRYQFLEIQPQTNNNIIDKMSDGIIVFDLSGNIIDNNNLLFINLFQLNLSHCCQTIYQFADKVQPLIIGDTDLTKMYRQLAEHDSLQKSGILVAHNISDTTSSLYYTFEKVGAGIYPHPLIILTFYNISNLEALDAKIQAKNIELIAANQKLKKLEANIEKLTTETERINIITDIFQTIGNDMMELLLLLESIKVKLSTTNNPCDVEQPLTAARITLKKVRQAVSHYKSLGTRRTDHDFNA